MLRIAKSLRLGGIAALITCVVAWSDAHASDTVGIFFDPAGTTTCLVDSLSSPLVAYLVLRNPSVSSGIAGWEGRLSADEGVFLFPISIAGSGLNLVPFPEFSIGLTQALPYQQMTILAAFTVYATRPGGLYFGPNSTPSLPEAVSGVYVAGDDVGHLIPMECPDGDCQQPLAIISETTCAGDEAVTAIEQDLSAIPISEPPRVLRSLGYVSPATRAGVS